MLNHVDDSMVKNLVAAGYSPDSVAAYQRAQKTAQVDFEIWQENWDSWIFFLQVSTQWIVAAGGMGGLFYVGLQRNCIESEMNMRGIKKAQRLTLIDDLYIIEHAALAVLNQPKD